MAVTHSPESGTTAISVCPTWTSAPGSAWRSAITPLTGAALNAAEAKVAAARAAVENARLQLSYAVITAPVGGV
ncbi:MAG TPA: hypothetical protein VNH46_10935, partial [Gemmatimonadales bacterium]|nr:hypothetical protein [Gemmatimonadales bacterium]